MCSSEVQRDPLRLRLSNDQCVCDGARGRPPKGAGRTVPTPGPQERPATALGLESPQDTALVTGQNQPWTHGSS